MNKPARSVRLDKWLWAARFFRTRAKAKDAIDGGKVHVNGQRGKAGKELVIGDRLRISRGYDEEEVVVSDLSDKRGSATIAQQLYDETADSIARRELHAEQRRAAGQQITRGRPSKRDRRLIHRFRDQNNS